MSTTSYQHIELRDNGRFYIAGTPFKVRQIALDHLCYGWSAEQIQREHPQLTLGQVYAALGFYYDHQKQFDLEIEEGQKLAAKLQASQGESCLQAKARSLGRDLP
jgi:uncharacterized protein (DUF433 family)